MSGDGENATAMDVDPTPPPPTMMQDDGDSKPAAVPNKPPEPLPYAVRDSLNGCWILDKSKGNWSMSGYLECMQVNDLAIKAHEKGEDEYDTYHTIEMDEKRVKITKRSRVNADLVVDLPLGEEHIEYLPPGDRPKKSLAITEKKGHLHITSSLHTVNGVASVTDLKVLETNVDGDPNKVMIVQTLTITNAQTGKTHATTRHFSPYLEIPPHKVTEQAR